MPLGDIYNDLINQIIADLKTIQELNTVGNDVKVHKWLASRNPQEGRSEAIVIAGPMEPIGGTTTRSTNNEFQVFVDLIHYAGSYDAGFTEGMKVAQKIYDKFHLTKIGNLVRIAQVSLMPGEGQMSQRNLYAIPIRVIIRCERTITQ